MRSTIKQARQFLELSLIISFTTVSAVPPIQLSIIPTWQHLDTNPETIKQFGGNWILAGTIDVKKRSSQVIKLDKLILHWKGNHVEHLLGSLYKKDLDKTFMPIQDYLICDSSWDEATQKLILKFDAPLNLEAHTTVCLVLTIPDHIESVIGKGSFQLESTALPLSLQQSLSKPLTLVCGPNQNTLNARS